MILKRMKRRHSRDDSIRFCADVQGQMRPDIVFSAADIIAGFPTETDAMFAHSLDIVEGMRAHPSARVPFSPREGGTPARPHAAAEPQKLVKERAALLREAGARTYERHLAGLAGTRPARPRRARRSRAHGRLLTLTAIDAGVPGEIVDATITARDGDKLIAAASARKGSLMAFGFIKKVFSFGKKEGEPAPGDEARARETPRPCRPLPLSWSRPRHLAAVPPPTEKGKKPKIRRPRSRIFWFADRAMPSQWSHRLLSEVEPWR